jgi:hypothetical protein
MMGPGAERITKPLSRRIAVSMAVFFLSMAFSCSRESGAGHGTAGDEVHGDAYSVKTDGGMKSPAAGKEPVHSSGGNTKITVDQQGAKEKKGITKPGTKGTGDMLEKPQVEMPRPQ